MPKEQINLQGGPGPKTGVQTSLEIEWLQPSNGEVLQAALRQLLMVRRTRLAPGSDCLRQGPHWGADKTYEDVVSGALLKSQGRGLLGHSWGRTNIYFYTSGSLNL